MSGKDRRVRRSLFSLSSFLFFFLMASFVVTCCFLVFLSGFDIPTEVLQQRAPRTFFNVIFLGALCSVVDNMRRRLTLQRPVRRILQAARRIRQGDFSARIEPIHGAGSMNELDVIIEDFNHMAEELASIETLRADFVSNVSHELKTPLAVIQNYATLLQAPEFPEAQRLECARAASAAARRLSDLVGNILRLNRLENQQIYPEARCYNLSEQLRQCLLGFEAAWEEKQLELEVRIEDDVMICADEELLSLVWNNLLSNAVKFNDVGGQLIVQLARQDSFVEVRVTDSGCGMSPEVGRHIFEKFYQGDPSHATQGNGLGLALVKRVVDIVGGEIAVQSAQGVGSRFIVRLCADGRSAE